MNMNRKQFLQSVGMVGAGAATCGAWGRTASAGTIESHVAAGLPGQMNDWQETHVQRFNMSGYRAHKINTVRVGIIGAGNRGSHHAGTMIRVDNLEIKAVADVGPERFARIKRKLAKSGHSPEYYVGEDEWKALCERDDLDLVLICTPTYMHAEMAVYAMEQGKHVITEVPAAVTVEECWDLVRTSERTKKHCMMMENYSFMPFHITTLNMARQGFFGEIVHGDGAYNTSKMGERGRHS